MSVIEQLKLILRESDVPFFSDEELNNYLQMDNGDLNKTAYRCLVIKAQDTTLSISGLSAADSSKYFLRLAGNYRPNNSRVLKGG